MGSIDRRVWWAGGLCVVLGCGGDGGAATEGGESSSSSSSSSGDAMVTTSGDPVPTTGGGETGDASTGGASDSQTTGVLTGETSDAATGSTSTGGDESSSGGGESSSGGPSPVCGDGVLDDGEGCDDGNADNTDTCVEGCVSAACGDGFVGPGETCDDGDQVDDDECGNDCAPASCGDGKLQAGEACDDGDADDTDGCLSTCALASCGDGFVQAGVETCDDANPDETDACTTLCAAPSCSDGLKSGGETDVDCGGGCPKCELQEACAGPSDCESGACDGGSCVVVSSCKALKAAQPGAPDGVYDLDPDGGGPGEPFAAYCDMTTDGGGWTLALRFAPTQGQFHFYSTHWTMESLVNAGVLAPTDPSDGKFPAYNALPGGEIRGCMQHPVSKVYGCKDYALPQTTTLLDLFAGTPVGSDLAMKGLFFVETQAEKLEWLTIQGRTVAEATLPPNYIAVGINIDDDQSCYDARVRFGLVLNNEANINTLNDAAGFGAQAHYTVGCDIAPGVDSPWRTACGFQAGATSYNTAGHIWIR